MTIPPPRRPTAYCSATLDSDRRNGYVSAEPVRIHRLETGVTRRHGWNVGVSLLTPEVSLMPHSHPCLMMPRGRRRAAAILLAFSALVIPRVTSGQVLQPAAVSHADRGRPITAAPQQSSASIEHTLGADSTLANRIMSPALRRSTDEHTEQLGRPTKVALIVAGVVVAVVVVLHLFLSSDPS